MSVAYCACAKLNLYLDITGRRNDGYHLLETVMQSVDLCDIVTVELAVGGGISVETSNPIIPVNEGNICYKAARILLDTVQSDSSAEIYIEKRIPSGAGLGGGSADAAAVLKGLNTLLGEPLSERELLELSVRVGADVPFCLAGGTRLCRGIGEILEYIKPLPEKTYLIVMPDFQCDTRSAYLKYDSSPVDRRKRLFTDEWTDFPCGMYNVFQELYSDDRINRIVDTLKIAGARESCLSGSGAAVFGVFDDKETALKAAKLFPAYFTAMAKPTPTGLIRC